MPPRLRIQSLAQLAERRTTSTSIWVCARCSYTTTPSSREAATATTTTPAPSDAQILNTQRRYSAIQPPSHRDPALRKSQLLRSYVSLLQTTPLIILFQHNNLKAVEWASIRRELATALQKVDDASSNAPLADNIKLTVVRTNILEPALRISEFYKPDMAALIEGQGIEDEKLDPSLTHVLSRKAHAVAKAANEQHPLSPLLAGPIALLTFPSVSPAHLKAALTILSPKAPGFPAPTRRANPGWHELPVQDGLKKLMLLGARIDGEVFDLDGVRRVGGIDGGIDGLRAQLLGMLVGVGAGVTNVLEGASRSLWFTVEGRRRMLEEQSGDKKEGVDGS